MATKTIRIDLDAYRRLEDVKQDGESFSQTIKRVVHKPIDFDEWMSSFDKDPLSDEAVRAIETVISRRR